MSYDFQSEYLKVRKQISSTVGSLRNLTDTVKSLNQEEIPIQNPKLIKFQSSIAALVDNTCLLFHEYDRFSEELFKYYKRIQNNV